MLDQALASRSGGLGFAFGLRDGRDVVGVIVGVAGQHGPKDAGVFVGHGDDGFLPADAFFEVEQPLRDAITAFGCAEKGGLCALDEQGAQVVVAAFSDTAPGGVCHRRSFGWGRGPAMRRTDVRT